MPRRPDQHRTPRLAVDAVAPGPLELERSQAHYLRSVLGLAPQDAVILFDDRGHEALARVVAVTREGVELVVGEVAAVPAPSRVVTVALATPKGERADWAVEKLTELGVAHIVWLETERGVVAPRRQSARFERWQRLARAAAAQCGRATVPSLEGPLPLAELPRIPAQQRLIADRGGEPLVQLVARGELSSVLVVVGPEGGLSGRELAQARQEGYTSVSLGMYTLRVETAAVAAAAIVLGARGRERSA